MNETGTGEEGETGAAQHISVTEETPRAGAKKSREERLKFYREAVCKNETEGTRAVGAQLAYRYPYEDDSKIPAKLSVSDIKKKYYDEDAESTPLSGARAISDKIKGSDYGTLIHEVMRFIPFDLTADGIDGYLAGLAERGIIDAQEKDLIRKQDIEGFIASPVFARLRKAFEDGTLRREQPFITGIPAREIDSALYGDSDVMIPVQGVIDCLFEEDGKVVVLDYKTDRRDEAWLKETYRSQLDLYMRAATAALGKPRGHELIYSFFLRKYIEL